MTREMAKNSKTTQTIADSGSTMSVSLDIAELTSALVWPLLLLILVVLLKNQLPVFFKGMMALFHRAEKISIGNFSMELAKVKAIAPQWTPSDSAMDIRKSMSSAEVTDSTAGHFATQLADTTPADFALVDLGKGHEWLSSRLYIISILLERAKDISAFVFVRTAGKRTKKFVGWAEPEAIRWSLARRFPWLEGAYARSYASLFLAPPVPSDIEVVSATGMLGKPHEGASPHLLIQLMETFLREVQSQAVPLLEEEDQWEQIQATTPTWEHACWLTADDIEDIVAEGLNKQFVYERELDGATEGGRVKRLLEIKQIYVPIVDDGDQFRELIDRGVVASQVLEAISS